MHSRSQWLVSLLFCASLAASLPASAQSRPESPWFLGNDGGVYRSSRDTLQRVGLGTGSQLAVHGDTAYLVGDEGRIWFSERGRAWQPLTGGGPDEPRAQKIVIDGRGEITLLGLDGGVYRLGGRRGLSRLGLAIGRDLAVSSDGQLYLLGTDGHVYRNGRGGEWSVLNLLASATRVASAPDGTVYVIGTDAGVYRLSSKRIERLGLASGREISVSSDGQPAIVGTDGGVYLYESSRNWQRLGSGTARQVVWSR